MLERVMGLTGGTGAVPPVSPGNSETIHCIVSAPRGDVPFESHSPIIILTKISPLREDIFVGAGNGTRTHYLSLEG